MHSTQSQSVETVHISKRAAEKVHMHIHVRLTFFPEGLL